MEAQRSDIFKALELQMQQQLHIANQQLQVQLLAINAQLQSQALMARCLAFAGASESIQQAMVDGGFLNTLGIAVPPPQPL